MDKWDYAHMKAADNYSQLSSARRAKVGCVIVKDNRIISIGYNGMPTGWDNCCEDREYMSIDAGGWLDPETIVEQWPYEDEQGERYSLKTKPQVLHAESNAIAKVARSSENCEDATIYCTMMPCLDCAKLIYQAGIRRVVYRDEYPKGTKGLEFLDRCNIKSERIE
jgi:dCMP deaminase